MLEIVEDLLSKQFMKEKGWIMDGYPRNVVQAKQLDKVLTKVKMPFDYVFFIDVPEELIVQRLADRLVHEKSGRVYNLHFNPPKKEGVDDVTGEPLTQRKDDNKETVLARLQNFRKITLPTLDYYRDQGKLKQISCTTSQEGFQIMKNILGL